MNAQHRDHRALQHHVACHAVRSILREIIRQRRGQRQHAKRHGKQISLPNARANRLIAQFHRRRQQQQAGRQRAQRHLPPTDSQRPQRRKAEQKKRRHKPQPHARVVEHRQQPRFLPEKAFDMVERRVAAFRRLPQKKIHIVRRLDVYKKAADRALYAASVEIQPPPGM